MRFSVLSRKMIESGRWVPDEPHAIVSISSPDSQFPVIPPNKLCKGITYLSFWDLCYARENYTQICNENDAKQVVDFFKEQRILVDHFVCHCDAGISRSAGVAAALSLIVNGTDEYFFKAYHPNTLVYNLILKQYYQESPNAQPTGDRKTMENAGEAPNNDGGSNSEAKESGKSETDEKA